MIELYCDCGEKDPKKIVLRGRSFECAPEPEDEDMIAPLLCEAYNPEGSVIVGKMVYLTHAPVTMNLNGGVAINCPNPGTGTMYVDLYADGQKMFDSPVAIKGQWTKIPKSGIKEDWRVISAGVRFDIQVASLSNPSGYPLWRGLQAIFLPIAIDPLP